MARGKDNFPIISPWLTFFDLVTFIWRLIFYRLTLSCPMQQTETAILNTDHNDLYSITLHCSPMFLIADMHYPMTLDYS